MATATIGARAAVAARSTTDRVLLREFLERDRLFAAYAICDLGDREFPRTRWGIATAGDEPIAVGMEYSGITPQPMFVMGEPAGIAAILRDVVRPRAAYVAAKAESLPAVAQHYRVEPGPEMVRMWVDRGTFQPVTSRVDRLLPVEVSDLNRLYQLGFAAWLPSLGHRRGRLLRHPRQRPAGRRGRHARHQPRGGPRRRRQRAHPRRSPRTRLREGHDQRRDRRAAPVL